DDYNEEDQKKISDTLQKKYKCLPVYLNKSDIDLFYHGFCNKTIWPLFHYFNNKAEYRQDFWEAYKKVNTIFFESVIDIVNDDDTIWIHDYQLMLLPAMIKEQYPNAKVGFFLHIPFPSYEIYRLMVWRDEILIGLLGADLIGFHTYDYVRHFLSSVRRLLGYEHNLNQIIYENRQVQVDAFPMGVDYELFAKEHTDQQFEKEVKQIVDSTRGEKIILSIDRLDYTKGIPERIKAFDAFLTRYPQFIGKVRFHLIVAPSREEVDMYESLRSEIAELVSEVNGKHGTVEWMPIWFYYQTFTQENLIALYKHSDILLVTPLRDGMNLVAKEYISARSDLGGMVVISETAGAASELGETVVVNPNDCNAIAEGIYKALSMPTEEKKQINAVLHKRIQRYNVHFWAEQFLKVLEAGAVPIEDIKTISIERDSSVVERAYRKAKKRIILLDYDGTLVGFKSIPQKARPDSELKHLLSKLTSDERNKLVIVSGRDRHTLEDWLGDLKIQMLAAHGLWRREMDGKWVMTAALDNNWKSAVTGIMQMFVDRMPGALIEEKEYSLAFHYRQCEPDMVNVKLSEVRSALASATDSMSLSIQDGNKVLEVKDSRVDKGQSATAFLQNNEFDFILGVGDDYTDEDLFVSLPPDACSVKIGMGSTHAKYRLNSWKSMRRLLRKLAADTK
ncbi:MAG: bifunctional alpha,alpha-trehalose-phosphate synthase (UDP-forming)/trehalose-phosphatase, partial [Eubacteriales bacterium]